MKIIVNALGYVGQLGGAGGAGVFLQYFVSQMAKLHAVDVLVAPNSKNFRVQHGKQRFIELPYLNAETLRHLRDGPTVVIDPFGALPCLPFPDDMALCVVVHDLMHLERPEFFTASERIGRSRSFAGGLQRADAVVTVSADQGRAIRRFFPAIDPVVIRHVPYVGLRDTAMPEPDPDVSAYKPFMLFPAVKWPHKNHRPVIEAFGAYVRKTGSKLRLVLCGGPCAENRFSFYPPDTAIYSQVDDLGLVSDAMLRALFAEASAVLFPTLYEGFGIPALEAAYLGKMVVASRLAVFDEILGPQGYLAVEAPYCHLRWMDAFAEVEGSARAEHEARAKVLPDRVDPARWICQYNAVLTSIADRYTHPALYPARAFASGDRPTSTVAIGLAFSDIHSTAIFERGARQPALGEKNQPSAIFRSVDAEPGRRVCLRAQYNAEAPAVGVQLMFSAWMRMQSATGADALLWSVNDGSVSDLLDELSDGEWHLVRRAVPPSGYIDLRTSRDGVSEMPGFDIELHDACILAIAPMPIPEADPPRKGMTVVVAALSAATRLEATVDAVIVINARLKGASARLSWVIVTTVNAIGSLTGRDLPDNVSLHVLGSGPEAAVQIPTSEDDITPPRPKSSRGRVSRSRPTKIEPNIPASSGSTFEEAMGIASRDRSEVTGLFSPYQAIDQLLLLESEDLEACLDHENLETLTASIVWGGLTTQRRLNLRTSLGFWLEDERGRIMNASSRTGEPIPPLDREVVCGLLEAKAPQHRPRFAVIETDLTGNISHHSVVSGLFLDGAEACGFQPLLGVNRATKVGEDERSKVWAGFSTQVYSPGAADDFCEEVTAFVAAHRLGPEDVIFMHSLSPQIVLGAARFVAAAPRAAPRIAMRFFSTAEAMAGHQLSYTKILRSIASVASVRERMYFFCESENLIAYYEKAVGVRYPLLLNPEHPSLAAVRRSTWFDPGLSSGRAPMLAYFGEARVEKGFDLLPSILADLLADPAMNAFHFLIQTGSNSVNQTVEISRAKDALFALRARHRDRIRTFESAETPEAFYFLMKHARGVIAPYRPESYGIRGTGVILEALQMGLDVFAWTETDLHATFKNTGRVIGVGRTESFADVIARHYATAPQTVETAIEALRQPPVSVCKQLLSLCVSPAPKSMAPPVLWVGNDTFGEGCSAVYAAQKRALREIGRDCLELFVPWPDWNWSGQTAGAYDVKIYGFDSNYDGTGLAWIARPDFSSPLRAILATIEQTGPTYARLRDLNRHMIMPPSLRRALQAGPVEQTLLNYVHLYPVIEHHVPLDKIVCETHDIVSYQHAVRRGSPVSLTEKIDEFSDLSRFSQVVAISSAEQREMASACPATEVFWRLPPFIPETPAKLRSHSKQTVETADVMDIVTKPSPRMLSIYQTRPDLQNLFELDTSEGRLAFFNWWVFFGQFEPGGGFDFSHAQYKWLVGDLLESNGTSAPCGLHQLMMSRREDLRKAFTTSDGIAVEALEEWETLNAEREFGFSRANLIAQAKRHFARYSAAEDLAGATVLDTVIAAQPLSVGVPAEEQRILFERISEIKRIDLVLVGSGHPSNIESFEWFIKRVYMPYLVPGGRTLFIVGSACGQLKQHSHPNLVLLGRCQRVEPMLQASSACPLPVIVGSGSPIKTIPALAVNGAVTVTERVEQAFGLAAYGIPAFSDPQAFANDLRALLSDARVRNERVAASRRYVEETLALDGYIDFWRQRFGPGSGSG